MERITEQIIRSRAYRKRMQWTEQDFLGFLSDSCRRLALHIFLTKDEGGMLPHAPSSIPSIVLKRTDASVLAYYSGKNQIVVNIANQLFTKDDGSLADWARTTNLVYGLVCHELAHYLYSDTKSEAEYCTFMRKEKDWAPRRPVGGSEVRDSSIHAIEKALGTKRLQEVIRDISNILEDGYIEKRFIRESRSNKHQLWIHYVNSVLFPPSYLEDAFENFGEKCLSQAAMNALLQYSLKGYVLVRNAAAKELQPLIQCIQDAVPYVDAYMKTDNPGERFGLCLDVLVSLWPVIKPQEDNAEPAADENNEGDQKKEELDAGAHGALINGQTETSASSSFLHFESPDPTEGARNSPLSTNATTSQGETPTPAADNESEICSNSLTEHERSKTPSSIFVQKPVFTESEAETIRGHGETLKSWLDLETLNEQLANAEMQQYAELQEQERADVEQESSLHSYATEKWDIGMQDFSGLQHNIMRLTRPAAASLQPVYDASIIPLLPVAKRTQRAMEQVLRARNTPASRPGHFYGKNISPSAAAIKGKGIFKRPEKQSYSADVALCILVDQSGSMRSSNKILAARNATALLYHACSALSYPVAVYGHNADRFNAECNLYIYADYDRKDPVDHLRIMSMESGHSNHDGAALAFAYKRLSKLPNKQKIMIYVSDGAPAGYQFVGEEAKKYLAALVNKAEEAWKINTIVAGIGTDRFDLEKIYGNRFLDLSDPNDLPKAMLSILRRTLQSP